MDFTKSAEEPLDNRILQRLEEAAFGKGENCIPVQWEEQVTD